jgi:prolipoprotein diacylglyceryl transferase
MHPVLFHVGPIPIESHGFFVGLALAVGLVMLLAETRRRGTWDDRLIPVIAGILIGGAIGGRAAGMLDAATQDGVGALAWAWQNGGRSILGGLSGAYLGALLGKRYAGYPFRTGDLFAPAAALALAVGRIGCFLAEAPGRPTDLPWGITVDPVAAATIPECPGCVAGVPMHPSFLYEIIVLLLIFAVLMWLRPRITAPGELFPVFLFLYATTRFAMEFTRANEPAAMGLTRSQWFIAVVFPLIAARMVVLARRGVFDNVWPWRRVAPRPEEALSHV